ncbi:MAG: LytTR family DNA-binding domain-containing protein [Cypionkella sp.]
MALWKAFRAELFNRVCIVLWTVVALFFVVSGPFGSYLSIPLLDRFLIGVPLFSALMVVGMLVRAAVFHPLERRSYRLAAAVTALVATVVMVPAAILMTRVFVFGVAINRPDALELALLVATLSLGHSALRYERPAAAEDPVPLVEQVRLLQRLDPAQRGRLWAISVRDHYVDVLTSAGSASLLMRFGDALAEVYPVEGVQVHRSHWVAWDAVARVEREGAKLFVTLQDGARIPVSRNHREKLVRRGLI